MRKSRIYHMHRQRLHCEGNIYHNTIGTEHPLVQIISSIYQLWIVYIIPHTPEHVNVFSNLFLGQNNVHRINYWFDKSVWNFAIIFLKLISAYLWIWTDLFTTRHRVSWTRDTSKYNMTAWCVVNIGNDDTINVLWTAGHWRLTLCGREMH